MKIRINAALILLTSYLTVPLSEASWWYLGVASLAAQAPQETCLGVPGLVFKQIEMCKNNPDAIWCVGEGVRLGINECQMQFRNERWNCTTAVKNQSRPDVFGPPIDKKDTRESAFVRAVTSAGVVHAVTQACSAGNLTDCSCDLSREGQKTAEGWKWGGCSDDVTYGIWFAETFVDAPETAQMYSNKDIRKLIKLHNNKVGRQSVQYQLAQRCRCHGVSGSCAVKSCWMAMPSFPVIGDVLKSRYEHPVEVAPRSERKLRRRQRSMRKVPINEDELVYVDQSPNFCRRDPKKGIVGTRGRECSLERARADSCDLLCCGRGYNTVVERVVERCHCKFVWCCHVKCKVCETMIEKHTCK